MKRLLRNLANAIARHTPKTLVRYWLKSYWYQPKLQEQLGFYVQPYRYDSAIPTPSELDLELLKKPRALPGLKLDTAAHLKLLNDLAPYAVEFTGWPLQEKPGDEFWFRNFSYEDLDAMSLYCMIRHFKPRRIIETGCGFSSRVMSIAARKNAAEGRPVECVFIEPFPSERIMRDKLAGPLLEKKVQDVPLSTFKSLQAGDFIFIDTSHVIKTQNDCAFEFLQLIPSLNPGVLIHVHDIFTPYDYPAEWILEKQFAFNEQYALEALMSGNPGLEIILPLHSLWRGHPEAFTRFFPAPAGRPLAFWLKTTSPR